MLSMSNINSFGMVSLASVPDVDAFRTLALAPPAYQPCNVDQPPWPQPFQQEEGDEQLTSSLPTSTRCSPSPPPQKAKCWQEVASPRGPPLLWRKAQCWAWTGDGWEIKIKTENSKRKETATGFEEPIRENIRRHAEKVVQENGIILDSKFWFHPGPNFFWHLAH